MKKLEKNLIQEREKQVVKSNTIISEMCCDMSLVQQKIVLYLIAQVQSGDDPMQFYEFSISDFCKVCGIQLNGKNYSDVKKEILALQSKSRWVWLDDDSEATMSWVSKARIQHGSGLIRIRIDEDLHPYLFELKKKYTHYELIWVLRFKSKYSVKLYELAKSIHYYEVDPYSRRFKLENLRKILGVPDDKLTTWQHFKENCLDIAVREVNQYSDKLVSYEPYRAGRFVGGITLTVESRPTLEREQVRYDNNVALGVDPDQLALW